MELQNNTIVFFEKTSHSYWIDGVEISGLTSLLKKHNLGDVDYSHISDKVLNNAAKEGTAIHELIQQYDEGEMILEEPLIEQYKQVIGDKGLKHIASEYLVSDNDVVATFIDKVYCLDNENEVLLADIKTTQDYHRRYLEWQLGANKVLFERQNPGIKVVGCFCIWIDKKKRIIRDIIPVSPVTTEEVDDLLCAEKNGYVYVDVNDRLDVSATLSSDEVSTYVSSYSEVITLKEQLDKAQEALKDLDHKILEWMEANNIEEADGPDGIRFKVKKAYSRTSVDSTKFKKEYPLIYNQMLKTVSVSSSLLVSKK